MADNTTFEAYQESGYNEASGVADLKTQADKVPASDAQLRQQAVDQYADTLNRLDQSYSKQIANLITSQASDEKLLNEQYNNSVTSMMEQLRKRGLHVTASLPQAQTAALNKHKNEVMAVRQSIYQLQREVPEQQKKLLTADYEKAINQRVAANRATNIPTLTELLTQISELQNASYSAYIDYLLAKKSGGGGGYRRGGSSNATAPSPNTSYVNPSALAGTTYKAVDIYAGGAARRQSNGGANARKITSTTQDGSKYSF